MEYFVLYFGTFWHEIQNISYTINFFYNCTLTLLQNNETNQLM